MALVLGVDSSTSACKVEVRDADTGAVVAAGRAPHPPTTPPRSEQHPHDWWRAFEEACAQAGVPDRHRPAAVAVGGQQHGMVVLDAVDEVLRPAKLWNDTESAPDADWLVGQLDGGAGAWAAACGSVPLASFTVTKLSWLHRAEPELFRRVARVLLPHDWLTARLTGAFTTDRGDASGTGYWSPAEGRYRLDLLAIVDRDLDWEVALPAVLGPTEPAGTWAATGAVVGPGTGDNMAAALGLGLRPGDLALSLGTSGTAYTVADHPSADPTGTVAGFADATGRFLPLVCTLNATKVTDTVARLLGVDAAGFDRLAQAAPPGAGGLVLVPHLDGERTPNRPSATGTLSGLRTDATPAQLARAAVEGVVCNLLAGAATLDSGVAGARSDAAALDGDDAGGHAGRAGAAAPDDAGGIARRAGDTGRVLLLGGGARSRAYRQTVADLTGRPVVVPDTDELVACGAAVQATAVLHGSSPEDVAAAWGLSTGQTVEPTLGDGDADAIRTAYAAAVATADPTHA
jgi:xylulokinase